MMEFQRLYVFDVFKMFGILGITFAHTIVFEWNPGPNFGGGEREYFPDGEKKPPIFNRVMFYSLTAGGHFVIQNGAVRFYQNYLRMKQDNDKKRLLNIVFSDVVYGFLLLIYHFIFVIFLANTGVFYCFLRGKEIIWGKDMLKELASQDSIIFFGMTTIAMKFFYLLLFQIFDVFRLRPFFVKSILLFCGCIVLLLTPFVRTYLGKLDRQYLAEEKFFKLIIVHSMCGNNFSFFPFFGFSFFGSCLGYSFAIQESFRKMLLFYGIFSICIFSTGIYGLYQMFGKYLLYSGIYSHYTKQAMYMKSYMHISQVGVLLMALLFSYRILVFLNESKAKKMCWICNPNGCLEKFLYFAQVIIRVSLSIFLLEYLMKAVMAIPFTCFFPNYQDELSQCLLFSFLNSLAWILVAHLWRKIHWVGSFEWFYSKIVKFLTGKITTKLDKIQIPPDFKVRVEGISYGEQKKSE